MSFEPIDWDALEESEAWDEWAARHKQRAAERLSATLTAMSAAPVPPTELRTTKRVTAVLKVTFHGSYVPADEIPARLDAWIDAGFNDRDDCRAWELTVSNIAVESGDPDGYDS